MRHVRRTCEARMPSIDAGEWYVVLNLVVGDGSFKGPFADLEAGGLEALRSSLLGAWQSRAGWADVDGGAAVRAKPPGSCPGGNGSRCSSSARGGAKVPCGPPRHLAGENPGSGQLAGGPWPWAALAALWGRCRASMECRHLVCLVANLQGSVMQRTPQDGVWTVVEQLEWQDMSVPLDEHRLCASQGVRELRRWLPGSSFVLSGGRGGVRQHSMF